MPESLFQKFAFPAFTENANFESFPDPIG